MKTSISILHIEDNMTDVDLVLRELKKYWININYCRVEKLSELVDALKSKWDIILSDFTLPEFDGLTALRMVRDMEMDTPFIVLSGSVEEDVAALMMRLGANDYIMKDNLKRIGHAISRELNQIPILLKSGIKRLLIFYTQQTL
jgi:CheY-like chemotaxis protein